VAVLKQFSYEPERIADDLYAIPLPLYDGSPVNTFVALGDDGLWLIDGGLGSEQCQATLREGIAKLGFHFERDVRGLLVTHGHNDHVGAADAVLRAGGQLLAHRLETTEGRHVGFDEAWLQRHGLPHDGRVRADVWRQVVWPEPTRLLEDDDVLQWGRLKLQVVWCPGHTPGLVCLYEASRRLLFTTDHVMRRAPAPVAVRNSAHDDPLRDYLSSVDKLRSFDVKTVLPGHGRPFHHLRERLDAIEREIRSQLRAICERLKRGPATAYEVLEDVPELRDRRPIASRYQVSLALARLRYLERGGYLHQIETANGITYAIAE
jgi:glyoxylase-like metal-dependent hydrolase (beta-lactamase superfamily II)